jgi:hypothetical protein
MHRWMVLLSLLLIAAAPSARPRMLGDAAIGYSADRSVTVNGQTYRGMVFHMPGYDRHEQQIHGIAEVIILDAAAKRGYLILPMLKTYMAFAFPQLMADLDEPALRRSPVGHETVNGIRTTKYRIDETAGNGTRARGFVWLSEKGILMRIAGTVTRPGRSKPMTIRMELAKLAVAPQDPALFRLPPGLVKLPSGAIQSLLGGNAG